EGQSDRLPALVADLVHREVSVITATGTPAMVAAKAATTTIPIVFETASDPIQLGIVTSLNRPGANVTGVTQLTVGLVPKELEILHELLPKARVMALLVNPADPSVAEIETREVESAARAFGLELHVLNASAERDFDVAIASVTRLHADALVIGTDGLFTSHSEQLAALSVHYAVPAIYKGRE